MSHFAWHQPALSPTVLYLHAFSQQLRTLWTWFTEGSDSHACELFLNTFSIALGTDKLFFNVRHVYHLIHPHFLLEYVWTMKRQFCLVDSVPVMHLSYTGFNTSFTEFLFGCFFFLRLKCMYSVSTDDQNDLKTKFCDNGWSSDSWIVVPWSAVASSSGNLLEMQFVQWCPILCESEILGVP